MFISRLVQQLEVMLFRHFIEPALQSRHLLVHLVSADFDSMLLTADLLDLLLD